MSLLQRLNRARIAALGALFDATNPREIYQRPLESISVRGITEEVNPTDRIRLVSDSKKLYANLGPCRGAIDAKAMYAVGRSWLPKFEGTDTKFGDAAREWLLNEFYPIADIAGNDFQTALFLLSISADREGDCGGMLTEYETGFPAIQLVPSHAVGTRDYKAEGKRMDSGPYKGLILKDGVAVNDIGRAVAYLLLGADPTGKDDRWISARDLHWIMEPQWIGQVRGLPGFASSILDLRDLRTTQGYEKMACQIASAIGLLEYNETGLADTDDPSKVLGGIVGPFQGNTSVTEMFGGLIKHYKAASGQKLEVFKSDRPGDAWQSMMNRLIRNALAGINWPYELGWDLNGVGGAPLRVKVAEAMRSVEDRQDLLRPFARRAVGYACAKAIKMGLLPKSDDWWRWNFTMPARLTADFGRDSAAQREDYLHGIINLGDICAERGVDLDQHIAKREEENDKLRARKLPVPAPTDMRPGSTAAQVEDRD